MSLVPNTIYCWWWWSWWFKPPGQRRNLVVFERKSVNRGYGVTTRGEKRYNEIKEEIKSVRSSFATCNSRLRKFSVNVVWLWSSHLTHCYAESQAFPLSFCSRLHCVQFSHSVLPNSLLPHEPQHARPPSVSPYLCHEVMGPDAMILAFWMLHF